MVNLDIEFSSHKITSKWIIDINTKLRTIQFPESNVDENPHDLQFVGDISM